MNKLIPVIAILAAIILISGCANKSSPESVLRSFLAKLEEKKAEEAAKLATLNSQPFFEEAKEKQAETINPEINRFYGNIPEETIYEMRKKNSKYEIGKTKIT